MKFCIGIPTINRADLLLKSIVDLQDKCPSIDLIIVDNGHQGLRPMLDSSALGYELIENAENKGVAGSWNQIARKAWSRGYDWVLIANDDIILGKTQDEIQRVCDEEEARLGGPRFVASNRGWCSFLLPRAIWDLVGEFDEGFFPAYFEDDDYAERMLQAGQPCVTSETLDPVVYKESQTIAKDQKLRDGWTANEARFVEKWGVEAFYRLVTKRHG